MRLIDADVFKEAMGTDTKIRKMMCMAIDEQPTAYDVEKVEGQIHEYFKGVIDESDSDCVPFDILEHNKAICKIVKEAGKEQALKQIGE